MGISWRQLGLFNVALLSVHVQTVDSGAISELRACLTTRGVGSVGVGGRLAVTDGGTLLYVLVSSDCLTTLVGYVGSGLLDICCTSLYHSVVYFK